jgi:hypothetical protein
MVISPGGPRTKNDFAGEYQHKLLPQTDSRYREF